MDKKLYDKRKNRIAKKNNSEKKFLVHIRNCVLKSLKITAFRVWKLEIKRQVNLEEFMTKY